jgi:hypothetical protein
VSQKDTDALVTLRAALVSERRAAASAGDAKTVIRIQHEVALIDAAISDEQALGQQEKDDFATTRALRRAPDTTKIKEVSLMDDPIRVAE